MVLKVFQTPLVQKATVLSKKLDSGLGVAFNSEANVQL